MTELSRFILDWWLRCALAGGGLLLIGWLVVSLSRQPAKRLSAGFWTLVIALGVIPLTLLPGWMALPWQSPFAASDQQIIEQPVQRKIAAATPSPERVDSAPTNSSQPGDEWFQDAPDGSDAGWVGVFPVPDNSLPVKPATRPTQQANQHSVEEPPAQVGQSWWMGLGKFALAGYGITVFSLLVRLMLGQLGLIRLWKSGRPVPVEIGKLLARMDRHLAHHPEVRVSDRVRGPICFGVLRPRIMLPVGLGHALDEKTLRWIFAHELSHVERKDPLTGWLLGFAQAVFFFCPWFWWLRRSIRLSQEFLADAAAIDDRRGKFSPSASSATDYAAFLVRLASCRAIPIGAAGVRGSSSDLFRRITMLVQRSEKMEGNCSRRWSLLAAGGLLTLGIALAGFYLPGNSLTAAQAPDKKDAKKAEPAKPVDPDDDDAVRKAIEELKKGPAPRDKDKDDPKDPPRVEPPVPLNPRGGGALADVQRQQMEMMKRMMEQMQRQDGGQPGNLEDVQKMVDEMMKQMQGQMQMRPIGPNFFPFPELPGLGMGGRGGMRGGRIDRQGRLLNGMNADGRMGIRIERPSSVLVEQLDLPREKGMVVSDVRADSVADRAGIKINDILMEIGGKAVPSEPQDFVRMVLEIKAETPVDVTVLRKGRKETLKGMKLPEVVQQPQRQPFQPQPLQPFPGFRPQGGFVLPQIQDVPGGAEAVRGMSMTRNNDEFTIKFNTNDLKGKVTGIVVEGKAVVSDIEIEDNGRTIKAKSIDKLDPKYQRMIEKMTSGIR